MTALLVATAAFLLTHLVSGTPLRPKLVAAMGEWPYRGLYSLLAFITLGAMIWAYVGVPREPLWPGLRLLPLLVMPFAFILIACGYFRNPTMVGADKLLKADEPARGMIRITRHPIMWGLMLWAASHLLARGDTKGLVFFGGFFLVAFLGTLSMDRRKRANPDFVRFERVTSHVPFVAIAQGRNRLVFGEIGWKRPLIGLALFVAFLFVHPWLFGVAAAQTYPNKPVRLLVGFAPGGANDILARIVGQKLADGFGQPVLVENRPGNAGLIAAEVLAKAPADGYTLMLGSTGTQTIAPHLTPKMPYDARDGLAPVSLVGVAPSALVVHSALPANSIQELIALAKSRAARPLTYASSGNGTTLHLGGELFKQMAGIDLVHVAYKGNAPALNDLLGGQVDMIFSALPPLLPHARAGKVRVLGIAATQRHRLAPEVPTIAEQGL
ncbi:MAG TPA: tripartite tricarboxylate transporter substrate-binding protein, partial [Burkholderiales bacterium]|nr:tripartite tricarboxylate transporter substrate-binding protein [Burkholderiales bacterium]